MVGATIKNNNKDLNAIMEMQSAMEDLCRQNKPRKTRFKPLTTSTIRKHRTLSYRGPRSSSFLQRDPRAPVLNNFKSPSLVNFDLKSSPQEHVYAINTQMERIGTIDLLNCKIISRTWKKVIVRWYMNLLGFSITH